MSYLEKNKHKQIWVVEDMGFQGVIKKIASGFSRGKNNNMELKFPWGGEKNYGISTSNKDLCLF